VGIFHANVTILLYESIVHSPYAAVKTEKNAAGKNNLKNMKKGLDFFGNLCYYILALGKAHMRR